MADTTVIVGLDEAGRGALAGPVVAGACVLTDDVKYSPLVNDSKQLTPEEREQSFIWIEQECTFGYGIVENTEVDSIGILGATEKAMNAAIAMVADTVTPTYLLVDGRDKFWFDYPHSSVIRGDETEPCISAASIVAKVLRDRLMVEHHETFTQYGFADHKGYGTPLHFEAIEMFGVCPLHRQTFLNQDRLPTYQTSQKEKRTK